MNQTRNNDSGYGNNAFKYEDTVTYSGQGSNQFYWEWEGVDEGSFVNMGDRDWETVSSYLKALLP